MYVLPDPPAKTLTMRGIAEAMFKDAGGTGAGSGAAGAVEDYVKLNGGLPAVVPAEIKEVGEFEGRRRVTFVSESGLTLPAVVWPAKDEAKAVAVLVSDRGKGQAAGEFDIARLTEAGITCVALDPRGLGETKGLDLRLQTYLGQAPAFGMGWDIVRTISALSPYLAALHNPPRGDERIRSFKVAVVGRGPAAGLAALTAALIEPGIGFVAGLGTLKRIHGRVPGRRPAHRHPAAGELCPAAFAPSAPRQGRGRLELPRRPRAEVGGGPRPLGGEVDGRTEAAERTRLR